MRRFLFRFMPVLLVVAGLAVSAEAQVVRSGAGSLTTVAAVRDAFRNDLGGGTTAGPNGAFGGLRREINWDGVPDSFSRPNTLPSDFFNVNSQRGVVFTNSNGHSFAVSAKTGNPTGTATLFADFDPAYGGKFAAFSLERLFASLGDPVYDVTFFVPGTNRPALVKGFGAVFTDVDLAGVSSIEYFDLDGDSLGRFDVPAAAGDKTFSFLGVSFVGAPRISRVRISAGDTPLNGGGEPGGHDAVAVDDFLYGEPVAADDAPCIETPTAICLQQGRFRVEAAFFSTQAGNGIAKTFALTPDSGTMSFFAPNNRELLIKVLNACALNNRFWVFGAAATNVGYDITVTDTETGATKVYSKAQGPPAPAINDTDAFATCP